MKLIFVFLIVSIIIFTIQYLVSLVLEISITKKINDLKDRTHTSFVTYGASILLIVMTYAIIHFFIKDLNTIENSPINHFISLMIINFSFIILPFFIMPGVFRLKNLTLWDYNDFSFSYIQVSKLVKERKIYLINHNNPNAYVMGILPFSYIIVITKNLFSILSLQEIESLLAHEEGHIKKFHLAKSLITVSLFFAFSGIIQTFYIFPLQHTSSYYGYIFCIYQALTAGIISFLLGLINKKFEKEADTYAAQITEKGTVISALKKLDAHYDGSSSKWSHNYPTLNQRIKNVENSY
jgi:Zn-dependent protease with chaperone function